MTSATPRHDAARHGSRTMYQSGCRCFPCRLSDSRYHQLWRQGQGLRRPVGTVLWHLAKLEASGWTRIEIAAAAGLGNSTLWHITSGRQRTVNSRTASAILSLQPRPTPVNLRRVAAAVGRRHGVTARQILSRTDLPAPTFARHELMLLLRTAGWSRAAIALALHRSPSTVSHMTSGLESDQQLRALVVLVPDPPEIEDQDRDEQVDEPCCEECGDPPMGGGRWCYPCYLDHRGQGAAA